MPSCPLCRRSGRSARWQCQRRLTTDRRWQSTLHACVSPRRECIRDRFAVSNRRSLSAGLYLGSSEVSPVETRPPEFDPAIADFYQQAPEENRLEEGSSLLEA